MLFNSSVFLFAFLPLVLGGFFLIGRYWTGAAIAFLALASIVFYGFWNPSHVPLLLLSALFNYSCGCLLIWLGEKGKNYWRMVVLIIAVGSDISVLWWYKYSQFIADAFAFSPLFSSGSIVLPLGISFYTFTQISYVVDCYRRHVTFWKISEYLLFVTYFPHLIAGPILRHDEVIPQFRQKVTFTFNYDNLAVGGTIFLMGLFKKICLADNVSLYVGNMFPHGGVAPGFVDSWIGISAYTLQLYFDFSGYSDMAVGLSRMFGVRIPINFDSPYKAGSIIEFWGRWHMSLSRFLRDYLYIPLGGNRRGKPRQMVNMAITMLLGGVWHGAGWTFLAWGALHGMFLIVNHGWRGWRSSFSWRQTQVERFVGGGVTLLAVMSAWVFFRAPDMPSALAVLKGMVGMNGGGGMPPLDAVSWVLGLFAVALLAPNTMQMMARYHRPPDGQVLRSPLCSSLIIWRPNIAWVFVSVFMILCCVAYVNKTSEFLYFQF